MFTKEHVAIKTCKYYYGVLIPTLSNLVNRYGPLGVMVTIPIYEVILHNTIGANYVH